MQTLCISVILKCKNVLVDSWVNVRRLEFNVLDYLAFTVVGCHDNNYITTVSSKCWGAYLHFQEMKRHVLKRFPMLQLQFEEMVAKAVGFA